MRYRALSCAIFRRSFKWSSIACRLPYSNCLGPPVAWFSLFRPCFTRPRQSLMPCALLPPCFTLPHDATHRICLSQQLSVCDACVKKSLRPQRSKNDKRHILKTSKPSSTYSIFYSQSARLTILILYLRSLSLPLSPRNSSSCRK